MSEVKGMTVNKLYESMAKRQQAVRGYNNMMSEPLPEDPFKLTQEHKVALFDRRFRAVETNESTRGCGGSLEVALRRRVLPAVLFPSWRQTGTIKQLVPCARDDMVVFFSNGDREECRRSLGLAVVETNGATSIEPIVRGRDISEEPENLTAPQEQLVTASQFLEMVESLSDEPSLRDWAYAYNGEVEQEDASLDEIAHHLGGADEGGADDG